MIAIEVTPGFYSACGIHEQRISGQLPLDCIHCARLRIELREEAPTIRNTLSGAPVINQTYARKAALAVALLKLPAAEAALVAGETAPPSAPATSAASARRINRKFAVPRVNALRGRAG